MHIEVESRITPRANGGLPRCISRLALDGGCSFTLRTQQRSWHPKFSAMVDQLRAYPGPEARAREMEGLQCKLPRPAHFGAIPSALLHVVGGDRSSFSFEFADRAFVRLTKRRDPKTKEVGWQCTCEAKAPELYARGMAPWQRYWLGWWSWLLTGLHMREGDMARVGWATSQVHVNCDFVDLHIDKVDTDFFTGWQSGRNFAQLETDYIRAVGHASDGVEIGRSNSDVLLKVYRKLREIFAKRKHPARSVYAPTWRRNGWEPYEGKLADLRPVDDVTRVEYRLQKKGLVYVTEKKGAVVYDFRNPAKLIDAKAMSALWSQLTQKRRLIVPTHTRKTNCPTDPAWVAVQNAGRIEGWTPPDMRQVAREVAELMQIERQAKTHKDVIKASVEFGAQRGGRVEGLSDTRAVLRAVLAELETVPPSVRDALDDADYERMLDAAEQKAAFFAEQATGDLESLRSVAARNFEQMFGEE